jgi:hypothetical protein
VEVYFLGNCGTRLRLLPSLPDGLDFGFAGGETFFAVAAFFATGFLRGAGASGSSSWVEPGVRPAAIELQAGLAGPSSRP